MVITAAMVAGGAQRVIAQLVNNWVENGQEIYLIETENREDFFSLNPSILRYKIGKMSNSTLTDKLKRYSVIREKIKEYSPNIILSLPEEIGIYVAIANIGTNIPIVVSERNNPWVMPNSKITRFLRNISYYFVNGLIFQSSNAKSFFPEMIQKKGIILRNPLDLSRLPEIYVGKRKKRIVSVGRLEPQKNFPLLLDAFAEFNKKYDDYELIIYGEGSQRYFLEKKTMELGLKNNVKFPGRSNNVLEEIKDASMFVMTSDYEGVPNALIEAMAMGMPVISTDCEPGGAATLIKNGINGSLVPIKDKNALVNAMFFYVENSSIVNAYGDKAKEICKLLDARIVSSEWLSYLSSLAKFEH